MYHKSSFAIKSCPDEELIRVNDFNLFQNYLNRIQFVYIALISYLERKLNNIDGKIQIEHIDYKSIDRNYLQRPFGIVKRPFIELLLIFLKSPFKISNRYH